MSDVKNPYTDTPSKYTLKPGVNKDVKVKSWSIEANEKEGKKSYYLKITYVHPQPGVDPENWSTINELINFPNIPQGKTEINPKTVMYGFMNPIKGFVDNFATVEERNERILAVFAKLGISDFDFTNETTFNSQAETMVKGLFDLIEKKGLFQLEGTLICGFGAPKEVNGETKQYLQPGKYGTGGVYKPAFRTNNDEKLYPEKTSGFKDDTDKKYNYWSYTRSNNQESTPAESTPNTTSAASNNSW